MDSDSTRLAVLIDADNVSPKHAQGILEELAKYGTTTIKRAYGDWTTNRLGGWKSELHRHAIQPVQQFAYTAGKNSTDSALIIDAMDLLWAGSSDAFAIVSSDSDFTRLATRLRESGKTVIGLGARKTPESLQAACDRFVFLEVLGREEAPPTTPDLAGRAAPVEPEDQPDEDDDAAPPLPDLRKVLTRAIDSTSAEDGWATLSSVGNYLVKAHASFDPRNYGFSKLSNLVRAQDYVEFKSASGRASPRLRLR